MGFRGNRLGFVAVGLGLLALIIAFSHHSGGRQVSIQVPPAPVAAAPDVPPVAPVAPRAEGGPRHDWQQRGPFGPGPGERGEWGRRGERHHAFGPHFFVARLLRTLIGLSLIGLGLWWLRNRRGGRGDRGGRGGPGGWGGRGGRGRWRGPGPEYQSGPYRTDGPQVTHL